MADEVTSTRSIDGSVTAEVARRQAGGTWLWVIDQFCIGREEIPLRNEAA